MGEREIKRSKISEQGAPLGGQKLLLNIEYFVIAPFDVVVPASASPRNLQFRDDQGLVTLVVHESVSDNRPSHRAVTPLPGSTKLSRIPDKQFRRILSPLADLNNWRGRQRRVGEHGLGSFCPNKSGGLGRHTPGSRPGSWCISADTLDFPSILICGSVDAWMLRLHRSY